MSTYLLFHLGRVYREKFAGNIVLLATTSSIFAMSPAQRLLAGNVFIDVM